MIDYFKRTIHASLVYTTLIGGVIFSSNVHAQADSIDLKSYRGKIFSVTPKRILPEGVYFKAMAVTDNSRIIFLECDEKEDSKELHEKFRNETRFKLEKIIERNFGHFRACLDDISQE